MKEERLHIRPMTLEDLEYVTAIEAAVFSMPWSKEGFAAALVMPGAKYLVAADKEERILAYCGYYGAFDEAEITNVAVEPEARRNGYATLMLLELLKQAKQDGIKKVYLEVRYSNVGAIALYERLGFKRLGLRRDFYERPKEDAIVMLLEI